MTLLGIVLVKNASTQAYDQLPRTLATDRGFKERVREDMLVRLLDAFVWRNHGLLHCAPHRRLAYRLQIVKTLSDLGSHTYRE
jgi:hypothetical protein